MNTKTVLIVEDEEESRRICTTLLRHYGYLTLEAHDGTEGLRKASKYMPDLILMDMMLPRVNGWTATRWLKEDPETTHIPIIAFTVRSSDADKEKARLSGVDSYVVKPCPPGSVLAEIRRLIGPAREGTDS